METDTEKEKTIIVARFFYEGGFFDALFEELAWKHNGVEMQELEGKPATFDFYYQVMADYNIENLVWLRSVRDIVIGKLVAIAIVDRINC